MTTSYWNKLTSGVARAALLLAVPALALACFGGGAWGALDAIASDDMTEAVALAAPDSDLALLDSWDDTAIRRTVNTAALAAVSKREKALKSTIGKALAMQKAARNALQKGLIAQRLQVLNHELKAIQKVKTQIASGRVTGKAALVLFNRVQTNINRLDTRLQALQRTESVQQSVSKFTLTPLL